MKSEVKIILTLIFLTALLQKSNANSLRRMSFHRQPPFFGFPYSSQAVLEIKYKTFNVTYYTYLVNCTATIITKRVVLTAAQCLYKIDRKDLDKIYIAYGSTIYSRHDVIRVRAQTTVIHPKYKPNTKQHYDIGMIKAASDFVLYELIQPAYPWDWDLSNDTLTKKKKVLVCGWGIDAIEFNRGTTFGCQNIDDLTTMNQKCLRDSDNDNKRYDWCLKSPENDFQYEQPCMVSPFY